MKTFFIVYMTGRDHFALALSPRFVCESLVVVLVVVVVGSSE